MSKNRNVLILFVVFVVSIPALALAQGNPSKCGAGSKKFVPNILGLTLSLAQEKVEQCGLLWSFSERPGTHSYEAIGTIGRQTPAGGNIVSSGDVVRGFVSRGFMIGDYRDQHRSMAEPILLDMGLNLIISTERNKLPVGSIIRHEPPGMKFFDAGTPIELVISEGPWLNLPSLDNIKYYSAVGELEALGLVVQHGGGSLETGKQQNTNCETTVWFPVVDYIVPKSGSKVFSGNTVKVFSKKKVDALLLPPPKGQICE